MITDFWGMPRLWNMFQRSWWIVGQSIRRCRCDAKGKTIRALARTDFFQRHLEQNEQEALNAQLKWNVFHTRTRLTNFTCTRLFTRKEPQSMPLPGNVEEAECQSAHRASWAKNPSNSCPGPRLLPEKGPPCIILIESLKLTVTLLKTGWYIDNRLNAVSWKDVWLTVQYPGPFARADLAVNNCVDYDC